MVAKSFITKFLSPITTNIYFTIHIYGQNNGILYTLSEKEECKTEIKWNLYCMNYIQLRVSLNQMRIL